MLIKEINNRRALRALSEKAIPGDILDKLLKAATYAPSCANKQPWRFLVLNSYDTLETVKDHLPDGNYWARKSPAVIAGVTKENLDARLPGNRDYAFFDTGMACMNLQLQAEKEGIIAHPIAGFKAVELRKTLKIPDDWTLLTLIILGYPGSMDNLSEKHKELETSERIRKPWDEIVFYNSWPESMR